MSGSEQAQSRGCGGLSLWLIGSGGCLLVISERCSPPEVPCPPEVIWLQPARDGVVDVVEDVLQ